MLIAQWLEIRENKKIFLLFKLKTFDITMSTTLHTLVKTLNKLFRLKYNSGTSCRKGEDVHMANL